MKKSSVIYSKEPLGKLLSCTGKHFLNRVNEKLNHLDIKRSYYALILISEGQGELTQQGLADLLESDKVSVVRIIDYLSELGYVKRVRGEADRRKYGLTLTAKAEKEMPFIKETIEETTQKALKGISKQKVDELFDTLNIIKKNLN